MLTVQRRAMTCGGELGADRRRALLSVGQRTRTPTRMRQIRVLLVAASAICGGSALSVGSVGRADERSLRVSAVRFVDSVSPLALAALPKNFDFFTQDADEMEELSEYNDPKPRKFGQTWRRSGPLGKERCAPRCNWKCEKKECSQSCEPQCAPPECRTICERRAESCETRCGPPQCAVVCPQQECPNAGASCGKCRTVCTPPVCTDQCGLNCQNVCEKPKCAWNCTLGSCPEPACNLTCAGFSRCSETMRPINPTIPPLYVGDSDLVGRVDGYASLNTSILNQPVTPPPLWKTKDAMAKVGLPVALKADDRWKAKNKGNKSLVGPVQALKRRWHAEDKSWHVDRQAQPLLGRHTSPHA